MEPVTTNELRVDDSDKKSRRVEMVNTNVDKEKHAKEEAEMKESMENRVPIDLSAMITTSNLEIMQARKEEMERALAEVEDSKMEASEVYDAFQSDMEEAEEITEEPIEEIVEVIEEEKPLEFDPENESVCLRREDTEDKKTVELAKPKQPKKSTKAKPKKKKSGRPKKNE